MQRLNFTMVPNEIIDKHLHELSGAEIKILLAISRKTIGWHKDTDWISNSQMMEMTGLSRQWITTAVNRMIDKGLITKVINGGEGHEKICYDLLFEGDKLDAPPLQVSYGDPASELPHKINSSKEKHQKKKEVNSSQVETGHAKEDFENLKEEQREKDKEEIEFLNSLSEKQVLELINLEKCGENSISSMLKFIPVYMVKTGRVVENFYGFVKKGMIENWNLSGEDYYQWGYEQAFG